VAQVKNVSGISHFHVVPPSLLVDDGTTTASRSGTIDLILKPISFSTPLPAEVWSTWFETLKSGCLGRLYGQPARPYSSPQLAQVHTQKFNAGIARARARADGVYAGTGGRWMFPYFARGRVRL
jgi:hypothetical protein